MEWVEVLAHENGDMDTQDLKNKLDSNKDDPALVVATIGTTFNGTIDTIDAIQKVLAGRKSFLDLDAALSVAICLIQPTLKICFSSLSAKIPRPAHKFFGYHSPVGLFMTSRDHFAHFKAIFSKVHDPECLLQVPGTITCSRNAVKPAEFY